MTYTVTKTNGTVYTALSEGEIDTKLGISLIGRNFTNYGQVIANNFVRLLENQANSSQPVNPIAGQLWWNTTTKVLSVFDGNNFKPIVSSAVSEATPLNPIVGDQWWDKNENRLKVYSGTEWVVIGPAYTKNQGFGGFAPNTVVDVSSVSHIVLELKVDGEVIAVINNDVAFTVPVELYGITTIGRGITLTPNSVITGGTAPVRTSSAVAYFNGGTTTITLDGVKEVFTATCSGASTSWAVTGVAATGKVSNFVLELTNGGLFVQTWMPNTKWNNSTPPVLKTSGLDVINFYTIDGGASWRGNHILSV